MTGGGQGGWGPRRVMPGCARRFSHLRKRVHRPGLRVSIARRWRRWFKFRKRKEVSPGSVCRSEKTGSPGPGHSPQPALLSPAASSVGLGLRLPFKFEFQRREPRACVRGGRGGARLSPPPHRVTWPRRPGGSQGGSASLARPQAAARRRGSAGGAVLLVRKPPRARSPTFNVRTPHPIPSPGLGWGVPPAFIPQGRIESPWFG